MVNNLGENNSLFNQYVSEIRDEAIQMDSMRFRRNLERVGEIFAYEISKKMQFIDSKTPTPLGIADVPVLKSHPVIASIMRAGLPLHQGLLNSFDNAGNVFISAYRKYGKDGAFKIKFEHISGPSIENKEVILADPMIATGSSMLLAYKALLEKGSPKHIHIVAIIASKEGINHLQKNISDKNITIWVGAIDTELTARSFIVPGLGDAGDLAYGNKE